MVPSSWAQTQWNGIKETFFSKVSSCWSGVERLLWRSTKLRRFAKTSYKTGKNWELLKLMCGETASCETHLLVAFIWLSIVIIFWSVFLSLGFSIFNRVSTIQYLIEWVQYSTQTDRRCGTNRFVWTLHLLFNYQKSSKFCVCKKFSNFSFVFDFGTFHWFVWLWDISDIIIVFLEE